MSERPSEFEGRWAKITEAEHKYRDHPELLTVEIASQYHSVLNNLHLRFPIPGFKGKHIYRPSNKKDKQESNRDIYENSPRYSELFLSQTKGEFYETLDRVIYEVAPNYDQLYRKEVKKAGPDHDPLRGGLQWICVEVFKKMRAMGYSNTDLIT